MRRRKLLIVLFALGTVLGFGGGFATMRCHFRSRHEAFERHVARVCLEAARESETGGRAAAAAVLPPAGKK
jgi:hypothetical protein